MLIIWDAVWFFSQADFVYEIKVNYIIELVY